MSTPYSTIFSTRNGTFFLFTLDQEIWKSRTEPDCWEKEAEPFYRRGVVSVLLCIAYRGLAKGMTDARLRPVAECCASPHVLRGQLLECSDYVTQL